MTTRPPLRRSLPLLFSAILGVATLWSADPQLIGENDRASPFYAPGEKMTFRIRLQQDGAPVIGPKLEWTRTGDDGREDRGEATAAADPLVVTTELDRPGFVRIRVRALGEDGKPLRDSQNKEIIFDGGAGVEPEKLAGVPEPGDFDAWWAAQKALLAQVPVELLERRPLEPTHPNVDTWDVKIACAGPILPGDTAPKPVSGYLSITRGASPRSAEAVVSFHGYGVRGASRSDGQANDPAKPKIILNINAHGIENGRPADYYKELEQTVLKGYAFNRQQNENPDTSYLRGMSLRVLRALEFVKTLPEWDGKRLSVTGGSQGAFQALVGAAFDPDVTYCYAGKPWLTDLGGVTLGRLKGWRPDYTRGLDYFDTINLAKRIRCETHIIAGLGDYVCPPSGLSVLYNNLPEKTPKRITYHQGATHGVTPSNMAKFVVSNKP